MQAALGSPGTYVQIYSANSKLHRVRACPRTNVYLRMFYCEVESTLETSRQK